MKRKKKQVRVLAVFLTVMMLFSSLGTSILAAQLSAADEVYVEQAVEAAPAEPEAEEAAALEAPEPEATVPTEAAAPDISAPEESAAVEEPAEEISAESQEEETAAGEESAVSETPAEPTEAPAEPTETPAESTETPTESTETPAEPETPAESTEEPQEETPVVENVVTFETAEGASVIVEGADATNSTAKAKAGKIVFSVIPAEGYTITQVLVDGSIPARTTEIPNEYIIEGIQTDATIVTVSTAPVETEAAEETSEETNRLNQVAFQVAEGAVVTVDGADATNSTAMAKDGRIVFTAAPLEGYALTGVLVDGTTPARATGNPDEYIIEGIQTDATVVCVSTEAVAAVVSEPEKPAQVITVVASDGAVIAVNAPQGALPEGAQVTAQAISSAAVEAAVADAVAAEGKELVDYKAYDITIMDAEGNVVQPDTNVRVTINNSGVAGEETAVYHVDGATAEKVAEVEGGNYAAFSAAHFSIYVVAGSEVEVPEIDEVIVTYHREYFNGVAIERPKTVVYSLVEGSCDTSYDVPPEQGYTIAMAENPAFTYNEAAGTVTGHFTEAGTYDVTMVYTPNQVWYYVYHMYQDLNGEYVEDESLREHLQGTVNRLTNAQEKAKDGFTVQPIQQIKIAQNARDDQIIVYVDYDRNEYMLTYETMGGSYIHTEHLKYGATVDLTEKTPTREGYTFAGWYTDEACTGDPITELTLTEDTRIYAKWVGDMVDYTVVFMTENANDDDYSYAGEVVAETTAGTVISSVMSVGVPSNFDTQHFTYKECTTETVKADGSTVIIAYYTRNRYTILFGDEGAVICGITAHTHRAPGNTNSCYTLTGDCGHRWSIQHTDDCYTLTCQIPEHSHTASCYEGLKITAKYQQDIAQQWMDLVGDGTAYEGSMWYWSGSSRTGLQVTMPGEDKILEEYTGGNVERRLIYYVEDPAGTETYKGKQFSLYSAVTITTSQNTYPTLDEEFFIIDGYDRFGSTISAWADGTGPDRGAFDSTGGGTFYYTKTEYQLSLYNAGSRTTATVPYLNGISQYLVEPENKPNPDDTFGGWCIDPACTTLYTGTTMPKGLALYAKWIPMTYTVTFINGQDVYRTQEIVSGEHAQTVTQPPREPGFTFDGWYLDNGSEFDFNQPITENVTVTARWQEDLNTTYTVLYRTEAGIIVSPQVNGTGMVGEEIEVYAVRPTVAGLEDYIVDAESQTFTLTNDPEQNVIVFTYYPADTEVEYQLQFVDEEENVIYTGGIIKVKASHIDAHPTAEDIQAINDAGYVLLDEHMEADLTASGLNTIVFHCVPGQYTITYAGLENATFEGGGNPTGYTFGDPDIALENPKKTGYEFTGWNFTSAEGEVVSEDHDGMHTVIGTGSHGNLEFTATWQREVLNFAVAPYEGVYDGEAHGVTVTGTLADDEKFQYSSDGQNWQDEAITYTDVTGEQMLVYVRVINAAQADIWSEQSYVSITPKDISIVGNTGTQTYDGTLHTVNGYTPMTSEGPEVTIALKDGKTAEAQGTNAGTYSMGLTKDDFVIRMGEADVTANYNVLYTDGWLTITPTEVELVVTVTGKTDTVIYNGEEQSVDGFDYDHKEEVEVTLVEGKEAVARGTSVGLYNMQLTEDDFVATSDNYSNIRVEVTDGWLKIDQTDEPLVVTITGNRETKTYNGQEQSVSDYTVVFSDEKDVTAKVVLAEGSKAEARGTAAGTYRMNLTEDDFKVTSVNYSNIKVVVDDGWLVITPIALPITITAESSEKMYDGTPLTSQGYTYTEGILLEGDILTVETEGSVTDFGSTANRIAGYRVMRTNGDETLDVTDSYTFAESQEGILQITKRDVSLVSESASKTYDGTALTNGKVQISGSGFADGEGVELKVTGSQLYVGASDNSFTYTWNENTNGENYAVSTEFGTLEVTALGDVDPSLVVTKNHEEKTYVLGENVEFTIEVTNIYDVTQTITITEMDGVTITGGSVFAGVKPGETVTTTAVYTVTEEDIRRGSFTNRVTAVFENDDTYEGVDITTTEEPDGHLTISKKSIGTPEDGDTYTPGETIVYSITAVNDGNLTLTDIVVTDELTGDTWTIPSLAPGAGETFTAEYVVKEEDTLNGSVRNVATAAANTQVEEDPEAQVVPGETEDPVVTQKPSLFLSKEAEQKKGGYDLGETIHYTIRAVNNGNVTLHDVLVKDSLTGDKWEIASLAPGESQVFETNYTVTEQDIRNGSVCNTATAVGQDLEDQDVETEGSVEIPVAPAAPHMTLTKETTTTPKNGETYALGETIGYKITVINDGNLTLNGIAVNDGFTGDNWSIEVLLPGASVEFTTTHVVNEKDVAAGRVVNVATAFGEDQGDLEIPDAEGAKEVLVEPAKPQEPDVTVTPTPTPEPEATATPTPTLEPEATATPAPTATPETTATPTPEPEKKSEAPKTGDDTDIMRWLLLMAAAVAVIPAGVTVRRRRKDKS